MISVEQLWADKYAALAEAAEAEDGSRRAEDFIEVARTVCGLELRQLTPRDLLYLDYAGNALIRGGEIKPTTLAQFLWQMLDQQPQGWWGERKFFKHCAALPFGQSITEIQAYLERTFADAPPVRSGAASGAEVSPIGTSFVAPLIVRIAAGIPSLTPPAIMDTPLPQLFQYRKILNLDAAAKAGEKLREPSPVSRFLAQCLDEANRLNAQTIATEFTEVSTEDTEPNASLRDLRAASVPSVTKIESDV